VPQEEHERVSETGVFPSLDRVSGTLCLLHYVTETSHLHSLRDFRRHFGLCMAAAHSDCCFLRRVEIFLLTYSWWSSAVCVQVWQWIRTACCILRTESRWEQLTNMVELLLWLVRSRR